MDRRLAKHEQDIVELRERVDFVVESALPAPEMVFMEGEFLTSHVRARQDGDEERYDLEHLAEVRRSEVAPRDPLQEYELYVIIYSVAMKEVLYTEEAEYFARALPRVSRAKLVAVAEVLGRQGYLNKPLAEKVAGHENLFAITIHTSDNPRVFYAYDAGTIVWLLNGYNKKRMKIPNREIAKAEAIMRRLGL